MTRSQVNHGPAEHASDGPARQVPKGSTCPLLAGAAFRVRPLYRPWNAPLQSSTPLTSSRRDHLTTLPRAVQARRLTS
jgi:hypothetical protein